MTAAASDATASAPLKSMMIRNKESRLRFAEILVAVLRLDRDSIVARLRGLSKRGRPGGRVFPRLVWQSRRDCPTCGLYLFRAAIRRLHCNIELSGIDRLAL